MKRVQFLNAFLVLLLVSYLSNALLIPTRAQTAAPLASAPDTPILTNTPRPVVASASISAKTPTQTFIVSGTIFFDYNGNGVRDNNEPGISGATVKVGSLTATTTSDGSYTLQGVLAGSQQITLSAPGFRYISLSLESFQPIDQTVSLTINRDIKRDLGLMQGFLTLPFRCSTTIRFIIYADVDPSPAFRDWRGSNGSDYVRERNVLNGHLGTDFAVVMGKAVVAAAPGVVTEVLYDKQDGNRIVIDHGASLLTIYCHLARVNVVSGQQVARGKTIGLSGRTGVFAPRQPGHLHFQFGGFGKHRIDPYRDVTDPNSKSWWTKDNDPQCLP
jgi:hypothetical protein